MTKRGKNKRKRKNSRKTSNEVHSTALASGEGVVDQSTSDVKTEQSTDEAKTSTTSFTDSPPAEGIGSSTLRTENSPSPVQPLGTTNAGKIPTPSIEKYKINVPEPSTFKDQPARMQEADKPTVTRAEAPVTSISQSSAANLVPDKSTQKCFCNIQ